MQFTINRATWRCGGDYDPDERPESAHGVGSTMLCNTQGFMCCLGQVAMQLGVPERALLNKQTPEYVAAYAMPALRGILVEPPGTLKWGTVNDEWPTDLTDLAVEINDDAELSRAEREAKLTEVFTKYDHDLRFTGEYTDTPAVSG